MLSPSSHSRAVVLFVAVVTLLSMFTVVAPGVLAADGELDSSFDVDGRQTTAWPMGAHGSAVTMLADGRIISAGHAFASPADEMLYVTRHTPVGGLDGSFGNCGTGMACINFSGGSDRALAVAVNPPMGNEIDVAGYRTVSGPDESAVVVGFSSSGAPQWTGSLNLGSADRFSAIAVQPDGRILAAGYSNVGTNERATLARFFPGGSLDTSFGSGGFVTMDITPVGERFNAMALMNDGRIVVAGYTGDSAFLVARYLPNGVLDGSFGGGGFVTTSFTPAHPFARAAAVSVDPATGNIVVAGTADNGVDDDVALAQYLANGTLDPAFDGDGRVFTTISGEDRASGVALQSWNGRIVVSGSTGTGPTSDFALVRYLPTGALDASFGKSGVVTTDFQGGKDEAAGLSIQTDRRIVAVGTATTLTGDQLALARYVPDILAPATTIGSGPSGTVASTSASFTFSSNEPGTFECAIDGGPWSSCTSPKAYSGLGQGTHGFQVRAIDLSANVDPTPSSRAWSVDTAPSDTTITGGPSGTVNTGSATFTFTATEPASFECRVDGVSWTGCSSPFGVSAPEGPRTFEVRATDAVGNTDPSPASRSWIVDVTAPTAKIDSGPSGDTQDTWARFEFTGDDGTGIGVANFECDVDGGGWSSCTSPLILTGLIDGNHLIEVRAVDGFGQVGVSDSLKWNVDTMTPDTEFTSTPPPVTAVEDVQFEFTGEGSGSPVASFECNLDWGGWKPCISPLDVHAGVGDHVMVVRAIDAAGNVDPAPATAEWSVDQTPPDTTFQYAPSGTTKEVGAAFMFESSDPGSGFECKIDDEPWHPCDQGWDVHAGLTPGTHTFLARAIDAAGNVDPTPAEASWAIDTCIPETIIDSGPPAVTGSTEAGFDFGSPHPPEVTFRCQLDDGAYSDCLPGIIYPGLTSGEHQFRVKAIDAAGNTDETPAVYAWMIDTSPSVDATLRAAGDLSWIGSGVVNATGAGQTRLLKVRPGGTAVFEIQVTNEALVDSSMVVKGPGSAAGFKVSYLDGVTPVTAQVTGAGYDVGNLSPAASEMVTMKIKLAKAAQGTKSFLITASVAGTPSAGDAVLAKVKVKA